MQGKAHWQGGLYPTIAVSDAFNTACHGAGSHRLRFIHIVHTLASISIAAAWLSWNAEPEGSAWLGFTLVAIASGVGTLRFGVSESLFSGANAKLADLAAFVGLPLVGLAYGTVL